MLKVKDKVSPDLQAAFEAIHHMDTHKEAPPAPGDAGDLKKEITALIEALQCDGFERYQEQRTHFFNENEYALAMFAAYGGEAEQEPKPKTLINLSELRKRPRPQWVIEGFIYENTIIELYAEAGCYKSFLAFDWSARIASGSNDWLGRRVMKKGPVVYIAAEGADGYISRGDAWCYHNGIDFQDLARDFYFWPEPLPLSNSAEISRFIEEVTDTLKERGQTPQLVVIDTLLRCSDGGNINGPDVMGGLFKGAETIKRELKVSNVLIVHHQGKNAQLGGMGSVLLKNNCDIIYSMSKDAASPGQVILKAEKMKDKPELTTYLRAEKVYYGNPLDEEEASLVIVAGEEPNKKEKPSSMSKSQADLLAILDEHTTLKYSAWFKFYEQTGGKKSTFTVARNALMANNTIEEYEGQYRRYRELTTLQEELPTEEDEAEND